MIKFSSNGTGKASLSMVDGLPHLYLEGRYDGTASELTTDAQSMSGWAYTYFNDVNTDGRRWSISADISGITNNANYILHLNLDEDAKNVVEYNNFSSTSVTYNGKKYKLEIQTHWDTQYIILVVSDAA